MIHRTPRCSASDFASHVVTDDCAAVFAAAIELLDIELSHAEAADFRRAVRRLRADLRTFRPVLDNEWVDDLRALLLRLDQHAEAFEGFDTALRHSRKIVPGDRHIRAELAGGRDDAARALVAAVLDELTNGWMLHRLSRHGAAADEGEAARLAAHHVLPGCIRRLWRHITGAGAPTNLDELIALAIWAEKGTYAAEAAAGELGEPAVRLASACRELWTLLAPALAIDTSRRVVPAHLRDGARLVQLAHAEWARISSHLHAAMRAVIAAEDATMTPQDGRVICGGGGVVWRRIDDDIEVLLVHRHHRVGWSLPKGKCLLGESVEDCAVREVKEETSLTCSLGVELPTVSYRDRNGRPKSICYWMMDIIDGEPRPSGEVDRLDWRPLADAKLVVAKDRDRKILATLETMVVAR